MQQIVRKKTHLLVGIKLELSLIQDHPQLPSPIYLEMAKEFVTEWISARSRRNSDSRTFGRISRVEDLA